MSQTFNFELRTPTSKVFSGEVSEVILPAHDGEVGVLANHEDFIGVVGTGVLKFVSGGDDFWYTLSDGAFHIEDGALSIIAEYASSSEELVVEDLELKRSELTKKADLSPLEKKELRKVEAQLKTAKRTAELN